MPNRYSLLDSLLKKAVTKDETRPKPPRNYGPAFQAAKKAEEERKKKKRMEESKKRAGTGDVSYDSHMKY